MGSLEGKHDALRRLLNRPDCDLAELEAAFDPDALRKYFTERQTQTVAATLDALKTQAEELRASISTQRSINADLRRALDASASTPPGADIDRLKANVQHVFQNYIAKQFDLDANEAERVLGGLMTYELGFVVPPLATVRFLVANHLVSSTPAPDRHIMIRLW